MKSSINSIFKYLKTSIIFCLFILLNNFVSAQNKLILISPIGDKIVQTNTPTLKWGKISCDFYKVWIDNIYVDSVRGSFNANVSFPLSFGKHSWKVEAYLKSRVIRSETGIFIVDDKPLSNIPEDAVLLRNNWLVKSSFLVHETGESLSSRKTSKKGWYSTSIPATVLTTLVRNGVYPNPYSSMNNMKIPDSNDEYNAKYNLFKYSYIPGRNPWKDPYWYVTEFEIPKNYNGKFVHLNFAEINYRADVWINGTKIADHNSMEGMEQLFRFNISKLLKLNQKNNLAVCIYPVDNPGKPGIEPLTPLSDPGQNMGDGMISKSYTKWDAIGWDWQPAIRDRDMGITEDVYLTASNPLEIKDVYVTSKLALPDTTEAKIHISASVENLSSEGVEGTVKTVISFENQKVIFDNNFKVSPKSEINFDWDAKTIKELIIINPKLWWPTGYGQQNLYNLTMEVWANGIMQSRKEVKFGIRDIETYISAKERVYRINGREIYPKGGNWVMDMMLNWTNKRYKDEILLTKNANLNILRVWGPTGVPPEAFFEYADQYGVMIWQDFLNDYWGTFRNTPGYTANDSVYTKATIAIVKKLRNHPSLVIWCGGNEGVNPREELITKTILPKYDPYSTRHYLKSSIGDGVHGSGPYHTLSPEEYFTNPKLSGFSSEIGPSGVPVYESILKFMPTIGTGYLPERFPFDGTCAYHDANDWPGKDSRKFTSYDNLVRNQYGTPETKDDAGLKMYFDKCQLLNYEVYRASIEAFNRQLWSNASGILLWKSNSSWPSMAWQIYDWYLQTNAGYYGCKTASENIHIQLNRDNSEVNLINTLHRNLYDLKLTASVYSLDMQKTWEKSMTTSIAPVSNFNPGWKVPLAEQPVFVKLNVEDDQMNVISRNIYCISTTNNYKPLEKLPNAQISGEIKKIVSRDQTRYLLKIKNTGTSIAYRIACRLQGKKSGIELLPSYWTDNYISLLPGETADLEVKLNEFDITEQPEISLKSMNMKEPLIVPILN